MTSPDEITRTADRLKDALGAAADAMAVGDGPVWGAAADVISSGDSLIRIRGPQIGHAWKWLVPLTAAASVVAIALATVFVGHPAGNTGGGTATAGVPGSVHPVSGSAPDLAALNSPGVRAARSRVVKITGSAPSCGKGIEGSGFVYAPQHVLTAAHDVAGITQGQAVTTAGGATYHATVVFYDPRADIAVLDVPGLNAAPLRFNLQASPGDNAVVAGYPQDQAFTTVPARIAGVLRAEGTSIYQTGHVDRQVYEIRALLPGDAGGPLLSPSGTVDGVVQEWESGVPDTGFALTASYVQADAKAAASATAPVSTQSCTP
jgi:S1-C subfamily serine protease